MRRLRYKEVRSSAQDDVSGEGFGCEDIQIVWLESVFLTPSLHGGRNTPTMQKRKKEMFSRGKQTPEEPSNYRRNRERKKICRLLRKIVQICGISY